MKTVAIEWMIYRMPNPVQDGVCAVEILQHDDGRHVVIVEELADNPGNSVSNGWEAVVSAVSDRYGVSIPEAVWIEHDSNPGSRSVKEFGHWQIVTFRAPKKGEVQGKAAWRAMTADDWHELGMNPRS